MFRAVVLSTVLTLIAGQNAATFCSICCQPPETAIDGCAHQKPITSLLLTGGDHCRGMAVGPIAVVRDDARRTTIATNSTHTVDILRLRLAAPSADTRGYAWGQRSLLARPPGIALRI